MSHIGNKEIKLPETVSVSLIGNNIKVRGLYGLLDLEYKDINIHLISENNTHYLRIEPCVSENSKFNKKSTILWGTYRTLINNMVIGVSQGYVKSLELVGVGYKANIIDNKTLSLKVGFSMDLLYKIPEDIKIECPKPNIVNISGINKQRVHQEAAKIRSFRVPEPYKGKGIRYFGESIRVKEGKKK